MNQDVMRIVSNWVTCFYVDDLGQISIDWSVHPPFGMFFRDIFWVLDADGNVVAALAPDQRRYAMVYAALTLVMAPIAACYEVSEGGKMLLRKSSLPIGLLIPDKKGNPIKINVEALFEGDSPYKKYYHGNSLYELTIMYNKLNNYAWNLS